MRKSVAGFIGMLLLGGCNEAVKPRDVVNDKPPVGKATEPVETPAAAAKAAPEVTGAPLPVNAQALLATTLAQAKTEDKRVFVHLGAPW